MSTTAWRDLDESELGERARALARTLSCGGPAAAGLIHLYGDLGAGKTTFARALLTALGVGERIKSPTYSLIESYRSGAGNLHHLDLYRIADPDELEWLGLPDLFAPDALLLIEWPERAGAALPAADLEIRLRHAGARRDMQATAISEKGGRWLQRWSST